jgi:homoserine O-acetyltransferase
MDLFDIADHGGSVMAALAKVQAERALVIGVETDFLFPITQQAEIARGLERSGAQVVYEPLDSLQGHDSFLVDMDSFRPIISQFFA